ASSEGREDHVPLNGAGVGVLAAPVGEGLTVVGLPGTGVVTVPLPTPRWFASANPAAVPPTTTSPARPINIARREIVRLSCEGGVMVVEDETGGGVLGS